MNRPLIDALPVAPTRRANAAAQALAMEAARDVLDFSGLFSTLWRGKWRIGLSALVLGLIGFGIASRLMVPQFRATTHIVLEAPTGNTLDLESVVPGFSSDSTAINTELEILRSRHLFRALVDAERLYGDPEFNTNLQGRFLDRLVGRRGQITPVTANAEQVDAAVKNATVEELRRHVAVSNIPQSLVFEIAVEATDAHKAARLANGLATLYIEAQIQTKFDGARRATVWLTARVAELKVDLELAEAAANAFSNDTELVSVESLAALGRQLKDVRARISAAPDLAIGGAADPLQALMAAKSDLEAQIARQSADLVTLQQLLREAEASRLIYEYFLSRLKEASVQQGIQQADSRIMSAAIVPDSPASPNVPLVVVAFALIGSIFSAVAVLVRETRQNTYRSAAEVEAATGLKVIGQLPSIGRAHRLEILKYIGANPTSVIAEAVRNLRTSVLLSDTASPPVVIMATSSLPGEGKTTMTVALAQNLAGMGKRVLAIECDLRRPVFGRHFGTKVNSDLPRVIAGEVPVEDAVAQVEAHGIDILAGTVTRSNPADLFSSDGFAQLLDRARSLYDVIVVDTPPLLAVPDARIIGQHADAIVYAVKWDATKKSQVQEGLRQLTSVGLSVAGCALTQIDQKGMRRYGYDVQTGGYGLAAYHDG